MPALPVFQLHVHLQVLAEDEGHVRRLAVRVAAKEVPRPATNESLFRDLHSISERIFLVMLQNAFPKNGTPCAGFAPDSFHIAVKE